MSLRVTTQRTAQPRLLRQINERTVFEMIRRNGQASRADMKRAMGVSAPTVSKAVERLLQSRMIEAIGTAPHAPEGGAGRPVTVYRLASQNTARVLGAVIAVYHSAVVVSGLDGKLDDAQTKKFVTPKSYAELLEQLVVSARAIMAGAPAGSTFLGIGVSTPGGIDAVNQRVLFSPNLPYLNGQSPGKDISRMLGIPAFMFHDMAGSCLAEQHYGEARNLRDFVRIGVYEGFGAAAVVNGRLLEGYHGLAGELGHVNVEPDGLPCGCGNRGCLETVATDAAFARALSRRVGRNLDFAAAIELVNSNDVDANREMQRMLSFLATGVGTAINLFNPQVVFVSSRMLEMCPAAVPVFNAMLATRSLPSHLAECAVVPVRSRLYVGSVAGMIQHLVNSLGPALDARPLPA